MIDLKLTKTEKKRDMGLAVPTKAADLPEYPYWARLHLDEKDIEKLGLANRKGGELLNASAVIKITNINITDEGKGKKVTAMTLQIQRLGFAQSEPSKFQGFNQEMKKGAGE